MKYYDLTLPLSAATVPWPGDQKFTRTEHRDTAIVSRLILSSHSGTHIDAPRHFLFNKAGIDHFKLKQFVGQYTVFAIKAASLISLAEVKKLPVKAGCEFCLKPETPV